MTSKMEVHDEDESPPRRSHKSKKRKSTSSETEDQPVDDVASGFMIWFFQKNNRYIINL